MSSFRPGGFLSLPPVVKNILIINVLLFLATWIFQASFGIDLTKHLAVYSVKSEMFKPYQLITHMFMHGGLGHLFFNMFALWMFGHTLEQVWGAKRFFIFYFVTGLGAAFLHLLVNYFQVQSLLSEMPQEKIDLVMSKGYEVLMSGKNYVDTQAGQLNLLLNVPTVGASGAVFGVLLAFGMLFPNAMLYIYFALPIRAKYFVMIYGGIELFLAIANNPGDNVAHFAHLGGMLFGFFLIKYWQKKQFNRWN